MLYELKTAEGTRRLKPIATRYVSNHALAVYLFTEDGEYFACATKNTPMSNFLEDPFHEAFVDVNNCPWAEDFLVRNGLAEPTGETTQSGYCTYPLYRFNVEKIEGSPHYKGGK